MAAHQVERFATLGQYGHDNHAIAGGQADPDTPQFGGIEHQFHRTLRPCAALNGLWMSHLAGPLDMGQIAVGCALGYLDFRHDARNWRQGNDALADWFTRFDSRPSLAATRPRDAK